MRISLVSPAYPLRGGIAHYSTMLCRRLRQEHTVQFVSFARQFPAWLHPTGASDQDPSAEPLAIEGVERLIDTLNPLSWRRAGQAVRETAYGAEPGITPSHGTLFWKPARGG